MDDGITLGQLWLPILLSAVVVFIVSALAWMVSPHHKDDFKPLPNEDGFMSAVRGQNLRPGIYAFPECRDPAKMKDPAFKAKLDAGPTGMLNVFPPGAYTNMGLKMGLSFGFYLLVGIFVAYLASRVLGPGPKASFGFVFQVTGTVAIMAHCFGTIPNAIWFSTPVR
ncbi:MAG: hypothetical protein L0219_01095, partial [Phycisphaerales bacterium]|nr:hypothetical protein [Phycisphaerales bacterium]